MQQNNFNFGNISINLTKHLIENRARLIITLINILEIPKSDIRLHQLIGVRWPLKKPCLKSIFSQMLLEWKKSSKIIILQKKLFR